MCYKVRERSLMDYQLYIYDCLSGKLRACAEEFMTIGAGERNTFRVLMEADSGGSFARRGDICRFFPHGRIASYSLNGARIQKDATIRPEVLYLFVLSGGCFLCWYGSSERRPDFGSCNPSFWHVYYPSRNSWEGPFALEELPLGELNREHDGEEGGEQEPLVTFDGLGSNAFFLKDMAEVSRFAARLGGRTQADAEELGWLSSGPRLCPSCWMPIGSSESLAIASHPALLGDVLLGETEMKRFSPASRDAQGLPLDEKGAPCSEFACPHCHHKLPPFFHQTEQHLFSLVGVPAAGKSYFLATLVRELEQVLPREFGLPFRDADPASNAVLNDMRMRLFSAHSPQEAYIGKTRLQGSLYQRVWREGQFSVSPRPFIYHITRGARTHSLVFYDNAGENYEPGRPAAQRSSADHLWAASAILFLFDPTANPGFRSLIQDADDPQVQRALYPPGRQTLLLTETEMRLRTRLNLPPGEKLHVPFALMIGKCDTWQQLLGPEPLLPIVHGGQLIPGNIRANSVRLRNLLFSISPNICADAEAISENVCYFAVSSFGQAPVEFRDERTGTLLLGPASGKVQPFRVTDPVQWARSCLSPSLLPGSPKERK